MTPDTSPPADLALHLSDAPHADNQNSLHDGARVTGLLPHPPPAPLEPRPVRHGQLCPRLHTFRTNPSPTATPLPSALRAHVASVQAQQSVAAPPRLHVAMQRAKRLARPPLAPPVFGAQDRPVCDATRVLLRIAATHARLHGHERAPLTDGVPHRDGSGTDSPRRGDSTDVGAIPRPRLLWLDPAVARAVLPPARRSTAFPAQRGTRCPAPLAQPLLQACRRLPVRNRPDADQARLWHRLHRLRARNARRRRAVVVPRWLRGCGDADPFLTGVDGERVCVSASFELARRPLARSALRSERL